MPQKERMKREYLTHSHHQPPTHLIGFWTCFLRMVSSYDDEYLCFLHVNQRCKTEHNNSFQLWIFISKISSNSSSSTVSSTTMAINSRDMLKNISQSNIFNNIHTCCESYIYKNRINTNFFFLPLVLLSLSQSFSVCLPFFIPLFATYQLVSSILSQKNFHFKAKTDLNSTKCSSIPNEKKI